jgi:uncharacterized membrane protein
MKKYFITGVVLLLPLALTLAIVLFIVNFLTEPFVGIVKALLDHYGLFGNGLLFLTSDQVQKYFSQLIILILLFFCTVGLGFLAKWFFFHYLVRLWEWVLNRIPFVRSVYKASRDVINTVFTTGSNSFKQVVIVPFPSKETLSIGFVTKENIPAIIPGAGPLVAVFVPTTPNPTSGFLMMFEEKDITYTDMSIENAFKYVISCGVISSSFNRMSKEEFHQKAHSSANEAQAGTPL